MENAAAQRSAANDICNQEAIDFENQEANLMRYFSTITRQTRKFKCRFILLAVFLILAYTVPSQAPQSSNPELIQAGSLIIPMDNFHQGNATGTTFNLRAYGLVNALLKTGVHVKWAIRAGKAKDDTDFAASVTRIAESSPEGILNGTADFSGGPFIVPKSYDSVTVRNLIANYNSNGAAVTVYALNSDKEIDIRYDLSIPPQIAIGPDGGQFGSGVYQDLFTAAGISDFTGIADIDINQGCYTMAMQAHSDDPTYVDLYRGFVQTGGNLVLQCKSIRTFENHSNGHFQAQVPGMPNLASYSIFGTNEGTAVDSPFAYPDGSMPFNQFIGELANQDGAVTEYSVAASAVVVNDNRIAVQNTGSNADKMVASVSKLTSVFGEGGYVFELGGHDYSRTETEATAIERLNGQRMVLNAAFVPASGEECVPTRPEVRGYKSVYRSLDRDNQDERDPSGIPILEQGDRLRWTIEYTNGGSADLPNFQIADPIAKFLQYEPNTLRIDFKTAGVIAAINPNYDGSGNPGLDATNEDYCGTLANNPSYDLLAPGAVLPRGGYIRITIDTNILGTTPANTVLRNQSVASGTGLANLPSNCSDNIDDTTIMPSDLIPWTPPIPRAPQLNQNANTYFPTIVSVPTAALASIDGIVRDSNGRGIAKAVVSVVSSGGGGPKTMLTNAFGYFQVDDLRAGEVYVVSVSHKRYLFADPAQAVTLSDSMSGLTFVASPMDVKGPRFGTVKW